MPHKPGKVKSHRVQHSVEVADQGCIVVDEKHLVKQICLTRGGHWQILELGTVDSPVEAALEAEAGGSGVQGHP